MDTLLFKKQDDVVKMSLPNSELIFTRYLYIKDEVRIALLVSILNKSDDAIYWGYELYYSGFKHEFLNLIWKIYYDFFATLNPAFESYFLKTHKEWLQNTEQDDAIVSLLINNLICRPFNTDMFMIRNICENFEIDYTCSDSFSYDLELWIVNEDYRSISHWILNVNKTISDTLVYETCLNIFEQKYKLTKSKKVFLKEFLLASNLNIDSKLILLSKIMTLFSYKNNLKKGKSMYVSIDLNEIVQYETLLVDSQIKHYNVLKHSCMCGIDDLKHLSLFKLKRNNYDIKDIKNKYYFNWQYHASFSPLWSQRIREYKGYPDFICQKILFIDEDLEEKFYNNYGYEPDEQSIETQNKSIMKIEKEYNWTLFYERYKNNGIVKIYEEELEEFDNDGLSY